MYMYNVMSIKSNVRARRVRIIYTYAFERSFPPTHTCVNLLEVSCCLESFQLPLTVHSAHIHTLLLALCAQELDNVGMLQQSQVLKYHQKNFAQRQFQHHNYSKIMVLR